MMPIVTLADLKRRENVPGKPQPEQKPKRKADYSDSDDDYLTDEDEDEDLLAEVAQDYSDEDWKEEDRFGVVTVHKGTGPKQAEVISALLQDERWREGKERAQKRFAKVIKKAKVNANSSSILDFSWTAPIHGAKYVWEEDANGTHELVESTGADGKVIRGYKQLKHPGGSEDTGHGTDQEGSLQGEKKRRLS